jgi:hypothetical protein
VYSFILTVATLYKDNSGYYVVGDIDIILAGPFCWALMLVCFISRCISKAYFKRHPRKQRQKKEKSYVSKSDKYIQRVVKRIIKNFSKKCGKYDRYYIDFSRRSGGEFNCNDIEGWDKLLTLKPSCEGLNKKFSNLMYSSDKDRTIQELKKYFTRVTESYMKSVGDSDYFISEYRNREFYILTKYEDKER